MLLTACTQKEVKQTNETNKNMTTYHKIQVEDCNVSIKREQSQTSLNSAEREKGQSKINVFYREAGNPEKPAILLLHGFPSSSHMFRELMPELADEYHLIAPDFPSFGQTESPSNWNELPVFVREFIQKTDIRLAQNNYVFCVATYGFLQGFVCEDARRELRKKGIGMDAGFSVKMPDNWTPMFDLSDPQKVQQQVDAAEPQIDGVIAMIRQRVQGNKSKDRMPYFLHVFTNPQASLHCSLLITFFIRF